MNRHTILSPSGAFERLDTLAVPESDRFDYWRGLHAGIALDLADPVAGGDYRASLMFATGAGGVVFGHSISSGTVAHFGKDSADLVLLSGTMQGQAEVRHGHGGAACVTPASGLALVDYRRQGCVTAPGLHSHLYLLFPRRMVFEAMGEDPVSGRDALRLLPDSGLFPFLWSHMRMLAEHGEALNAQETEAALQAATGLAMAGLRQLRGAGADEADSTAEENLFAAAKRFIEMRLGDGGLTAAAVAAAVGCSRAHLYRVFAARGLTIGDHLREVRLETAKQMLASRTRRTIAQIAYEAGYAGVTPFGRAFRQRYGLSPGEWRTRNGWSRRSD